MRHRGRDQRAPRRLLCGGSRAAAQRLQRHRPISGQRKRSKATDDALVCGRHHPRRGVQKPRQKPPNRIGTASRPRRLLLRGTFRDHARRPLAGFPPEGAPARCSLEAAPTCARAPYGGPLLPRGASIRCPLLPDAPLPRCVFGERTHSRKPRSQRIVCAPLFCLAASCACCRCHRSPRCQTAGS